MTVIEILSVLFFCLWLFLLWLGWPLYWKFHKIPFGPIKFPYIYGSISKEKNLSSQLADFYKAYRTDYPIIGFHISCKPAVLTVNFQLISLILTKHSNYFRNRGKYYNDKDSLSVTLGTLDDDKWKMHRQKLTPFFTPANLFGKMKIFGDKLVAGLWHEITATGKETMKIQDLINQLSIDVIGAMIVGIESTTELHAMMQKAKKPYMKFPWNIWTIAHPEFSRHRGIRKHPKEVCNYIVRLVEEIVQYRKRNNVQTNDYIQLLINADLDTKTIATIAFDLLLTGCADSSLILSYCLHELSVNKHIQQEARNQIRLVLQQHNGELTYEALNEMIYLKKIIKETLRMYPVTGNITRIATAAYNVPNTNFTIPKGMRIFIPTLAVHYDERFYPNPNEFNPNREFPTGAFLPFGLGERKCIGRCFAQLFVEVSLVSLLQNFEFSTCDRTQTSIEFSSINNTLTPIEGVSLKVRRI